MMSEDELKKIEAAIQQEMMLTNRRPVEDFDNLSPDDMYRLVYLPFDESCCVQFKEEITGETLDNCAFFRLVEALIAAVKKEKEMKLTKKGNLSVKLVKELYGLGFIQESLIEDGIYKLYKQEDVMSITNAKIMLETIGITKKRNGKWSLTKKGEKLSESKNRLSLFKEVFQTYAFRYNWGYHDGFPDEADIRSALGYSIYLFLTYGDEMKRESFYAEKITKAYPQLLEFFLADSFSTTQGKFQCCYKIRLISRFFKWFSFLDVIENKKKDFFNENEKIKNNLLGEIFEIRKENFQFIKPKLND